MATRGFNVSPLDMRTMEYTKYSGIAELLGEAYRLSKGRDLVREVGKGQRIQGFASDATKIGLAAAAMFVNPALGGQILKGLAPDAMQGVDPVKMAETLGGDNLWQGITSNIGKSSLGNVFGNKEKEEPVEDWMTDLSTWG